MDITSPFFVVPVIVVVFAVATYFAARTKEDEPSGH
jgi:hypothetical protein